MRPFALIFLLFLVGMAAWLLWDKLVGRSSAPEPADRLSTAPIEITDSAGDTLSASLSSMKDTAGGISAPMDKGDKGKSPAVSVAQPATKGIQAYIDIEKARPRSAAECQYIRHTHFALCYDEEHEQPRWTVHILDGAKLREGRVRRTQDFRPDPKVTTRSAQLSDYRRSGYDRGHLVPAGDFKWDSTGMSETFYMSNMSPQIHEFNAGIWEEVESTVRSWARRKGRLVVYTGPVLNKIQQRVGESRVSVPGAFYKVVYHLDEKNPAAAAFLVPHAPSRRAPTDFLVPVDSVEKVTGIDFFPALPDALEEKIESRLERRLWETSPRRR